MKVFIRKIVSLKKRSVAAYMVFVICLPLAVSAQSIFCNPLDIPMELSANFGEVRPDHFHTGFDIRTNEQTGYNVYAAADGYVSRVKVSPYGYGKAIYITHPNGYMTVYGHLSAFNDAIGKFVRNEQYAKQSFDVDLSLPSSKFPVKQGDLIGYSGNSGGSTGPHLHFEIREASGESFPLNPASFFRLYDMVPPQFNRLYIYPIDERTELPTFYPAVNDTLSTDTSIKKFAAVNDSITIDTNTFGVGVEAADFMNDSQSDFGIYELSLRFDNRLIFSVKFDRLDFSEGRYANAYIDYGLKEDSGKIVQRLFRLPGDDNSLYHNLVNDGKISVTDTLYHKIEIAAADAYGNRSNLNVYIRFSGRIQAYHDSTVTKVFKYNEANSFSSDSISLSFPINTFYEDLYFHYSKSDTVPAGVYSAIFHVDHPQIPVNGSYEIRILPRMIPSSRRSKAVIMYEDDKGNTNSKTTTREGDWLVAHARELGNYYVMVDTTPPKITVRLKQNRKLTSNSIRFDIRDNLSGIDSYKGFLDGKWVLLDYDAKYGRLTFSVDPKLHLGYHSIKVIVTDDVKNKSSYTLRFRK